MKKIITVVSVIVIAAVCAGGYLYNKKRSEADRPVEYEFAAVTRGDVERLIVSTGTLDPVGSVEVGTQVSGTIEKVLVDFNDTVRAGQIIAEIDRSLLISRLSEVQASLTRAEALFAQSEQEFKRGESLAANGLISEQEFLRLSTEYQTQRASLQVARASVATAEENVRYATIRSPVRGTVISRNVDVGQTVAASLSAPTLFIIAEDLRRMKIMAQVDETDIGRIRENQDVRFTVQAYPNKKYSGSVSQVRLQPEVIQNVVTYTVVILADNDDGTLLPGMTANVEFIEAREENALTVPMAALRFRPPEEVMQKFEEERKAQMEQRKAQRRELAGEDGHERLSPGSPDQFAKSKRGDGIRDGSGEHKSQQTGLAGGGERKSKQTDGKNRDERISKQTDGKRGDRGNRKRSGNLEPGERAVLWTVDSAGTFSPIPIRLGINDGVRCVVFGKPDGESELQEGTRVVSGTAKSDKGKAKKGGDSKQQRSIIPQGGGAPGPRRI